VIVAGHLGAQIVSDHHRVGVLVDAVDAIRTNLLGQRLVADGIGRSHVGIKLVAPGHDFVADLQGFRGVGHSENRAAATAMVTAAKFLLEQIKFRFDLTGFTIAPGLVIRIGGVIGDEFAQLDHLVRVDGRLDRFDPGSRPETFDGLNFHLGRLHLGLDLCRHTGSRRIISEDRRGNEHGRSMDQVPRAIIHQPIVFDGRGTAVITDAKMFATEIQRRIRELMAEGRRDPAGGNRGVA